MKMNLNMPVISKQILRSKSKIEILVSRCRNLPRHLIFISSIQYEDTPPDYYEETAAKECLGRTTQRQFWLVQSLKAVLALALQMSIYLVRRTDSSLVYFMLSHG